MPVTLAMPAIDRSISAHRITKVRPTAMMPVTETWVRMLPTLSSVAKEGLASAKNPVRKIRVRNGAILRIWERSIAARVRGCFRSVAETVALSPVTMCVSSGGFQQAVLADRLVGEFLHHDAPLENDDAIGKRQHGLGLGRKHHDGEPARAQLADDVDHVVLGADVHAARRLAQHQYARRVTEPFGQRHLLLVATRQHAEIELDGRRPDLQLLDLARGDRPLALWLEEQRGYPVEDADRDVLVHRFLMEQHGAAALGDEGDAGAPGVGGAAEALAFAADRQRALIGPQLAKENPRQFRLPASHEAVNAEHLAGPRVKRHVAEAAGERQ